jgi:hypothetical protein
VIFHKTENYNFVVFSILLIFQDRGFTVFLPGLALNLNPPNLCFPSSWNYWCAPLCPAEFLDIFTGIS